MINTKHKTIHQHCVCTVKQLICVRTMRLTMAIGRHVWWWWETTKGHLKIAEMLFKSMINSPKATTEQLNAASRSVILLVPNKLSKNSLKLDQTMISATNMKNNANNCVRMVKKLPNATRKRTSEQPVITHTFQFSFIQLFRKMSKFYLFFICPVFHADGALKIATACSSFKLLKAECLALLGRVEVSCQYAN